LQTSSALILTDDSEFARLLSACWRAERRPPALTVLNSQAWKAPEPGNYDVIVIGPVVSANVSRIVEGLSPATGVILCATLEAHEIHQLRARYPNLLFVPLRDEWTQTLVLVAGESLKRTAALREVRQAYSRAAKSEGEAILGRYMLEMKHTVNNALTSILGNAELLLLEPGQLSVQSIQQIKTVHQMSLRIHEVMQRFSSLASEIRDAETASHAETHDTADHVTARS
jgi:signal transduction histidine kinase